MRAGGLHGELCSGVGPSEQPPWRRGFTQGRQFNRKTNSLNKQKCHRVGPKQRTVTDAGLAVVCRILVGSLLVVKAAPTRNRSDRSEAPHTPWPHPDPRWRFRPSGSPFNNPAAIGRSASSEFTCGVVLRRLQRSRNARREAEAETRPLYRCGCGQRPPEQRLVSPIHPSDLRPAAPRCAQPEKLVLLAWLELEHPSPRSANPPDALALQRPLCRQRPSSPAPVSRRPIAGCKIPPAARGPGEARRSQASSPAATATHQLAGIATCLKAQLTRAQGSCRAPPACVVHRHAVPMLAAGIVNSNGAGSGRRPTRSSPAGGHLFQTPRPAGAGHQHRSAGQ